MGTWTAQGFEAKTLSYYKSAIQQVFVDAFGNDFALDDTLPQGVLIQRLAELFYGMDMDGIEAFSRLNLNTMTGLFLDMIGNFRGIPRILGTPQTGVVTITSVSQNFTPYTLPANTILTVNGTGDTFKTKYITSFTTADPVSIEVEYTEDGNSNSIVGNTLTVEGYPQITNIELISLFDGSNNESDLDYRHRLQTDYPASVNTVEYVLAELRKLQSVRSVGCAYNDTDTTDTDGIPAYATEFMVVPKAGLAAASIDVMKTETGKIILNNKTPGAPTYGNTTVQVPDSFGTIKTVNFTIATKIEVEIDVVVSTPESTGVLDLSRESEIKQTIVNYINTLDIGKDVSYSRCIAPLAADPGFDILTFKMRDKNEGTWISNGNLTIGLREYAEISANDITIGV